MVGNLKRIIHGVLRCTLLEKERRVFLPRQEHARQQARNWLLRLPVLPDLKDVPFHTTCDKRAFGRRSTVVGPRFLRNTGSLGTFATNPLPNKTFRRMNDETHHPGLAVEVDRLGATALAVTAVGTVRSYAVIGYMYAYTQT